MNESGATRLRDTIRKLRARGIPDREDYGGPENIPEGELVPYVHQRHDAVRRGPHSDIRVGRRNMLSWALSKDKYPPRPGEKKVVAVGQPAHEESYRFFRGHLGPGFGQGEVKREDLGEALILEAKPNKIKFVVAHKKIPEEFTMVRIGKGPGGKGKPIWYMFNTTPHEPVANKKLHYRKLPAEQVDELMDPEYVASNKIDGASAFLQLMSDHVNILSYRTRKTGEPILHHYRFGAGVRNLKVPRTLQGAVLTGEIYGERKGKVIPPQELGGLLNSALARSLRKQKETGTKLRMALYGVKSLPEDVEAAKEFPINRFPVATPDEQRRTIENVLQFLPEDTFTTPEYATTSEEKKRLWDQVLAGEDPYRYEGLVGVPEAGGIPTAVKPRPDYDVHVRSIVPGSGKYRGRAAGGFWYALNPEGEPVGKVGTGFSDEVRRDMLEHPEDYVGRVARVLAQERFSSGALRAPSFIALHEDYPSVEEKAAGLGRNRTDFIRRLIIASAANKK